MPFRTALDWGYDSGILNIRECAGHHARRRVRAAWECLFACGTHSGEHGTRQRPHAQYRHDSRAPAIDGFGASITEATSWLWHNRVTDKERCIRDLFSPRDGIGISMLRQPIGPSDHVSAPYRFVRRFPDRKLNSLDFTPEMERVLPMVEAANDCALATQSHALNIMASPWSAPWWMKTNLSVLGKRRYTRITGHLRRGMYAAYARYITGFARLYAQRGLPLFALTVTNEPDYPQSRWPSMAMTPREQAEFVARHLRPMLDHAGLDGTRILCWDHNYSTDHYPDGAFVRDMYADSAALAACAGSAWHYYGGSARTMSRIHDAFPNKGIWVTEASGGDWGPRNFTPALLSLGTAVIDMMNNWARSAVLWNIALDEHGGPDYYYLRNDRRHSENRGLITVRDDGSIRRNADYYALGHFSKYVPIGSHCVECALDHAQGVRAAAFLLRPARWLRFSPTSMRNPYGCNAKWMAAGSGCACPPDR